MKNILTIEGIQEVIKEKIPEGLIVSAHDDLGHHYRHTPTGQIFDSVTTQMQGVIDDSHLKVWAARLAVEHMDNSLTFNPEMLKDRNIMEQLKDASIMKHRDTFEDAGGIGTVGHGAVEEYSIDWINTKIQPKEVEKFISGKDAREWAILRSAIEFFNDYYFLPIASELLVCNLKDKYAGTLDCLGFVIIPEKRCTKENGRHDFWNESSKDWRKKICYTCGLKAKYKFALIDYKTSNSIQKKPKYCAQVSAYAKAFTSMTGLKPEILIIVRIDKKQAKYETLKVSDPADCYKAFLDMKKVNIWLNSKSDHGESIIKKEIIKII